MEALKGHVPVFGIAGKSYSDMDPKMEKNMLTIQCFPVCLVASSGIEEL